MYVSSDNMYFHHVLISWYRCQPITDQILSRKFTDRMTASYRHVSFSKNNRQKRQLVCDCL